MVLCVAICDRLLPGLLAGCFRSELRYSVFLSQDVDSRATSFTNLSSGDALFASSVVNVLASCFSTETDTTFTR